MINYPETAFSLQSTIIKLAIKKTAVTIKLLLLKLYKFQS